MKTARISTSLFRSMFFDFRTNKYSICRPTAEPYIQLVRNIQRHITLLSAQLPRVKEQPAYSMSRYQKAVRCTIGRTHHAMIMCWRSAISILIDSSTFCLEHIRGTGLNFRRVSSAEYMVTQALTSTLPLGSKPTEAQFGGQRALGSDFLLWNARIM